MLSVRKPVTRKSIPVKSDPSAIQENNTMSLVNVPANAETIPAGNDTIVPSNVPSSSGHHMNGAPVLAKGIALPEAKGFGDRKAKYPWATMDVGDAFFVRGGNIKGFYTQANGAAKKHEGRKFAVRKVDGSLFGEDKGEGVGIWRTA